MEHTLWLQLTAFLGSSGGKDDVISIYRLRFPFDRERAHCGAKCHFVYIFVSSEELRSQLSTLAAAWRDELVSTWWPWRFLLPWLTHSTHPVRLPLGLNEAGA